MFWPPAGVCMSDWHIMNGDWPMPLPMVLGHEAAGNVVENGPGVIAVKPGDHVIFSFRPHCGQCRLGDARRHYAREAQRRAGQPDGADRNVRRRGALATRVSESAVCNISARCGPEPTRRDVRNRRKLTCGPTPTE